jgi:hypothetical protein
MIHFNLLNGTLVIRGRLFQVEGTPVRETVVDAYGNYHYDFRNGIRLRQGPFTVADTAETRIELDRLVDDGVIEVLTEEPARAYRESAP